MNRVIKDYAKLHSTVQEDVYDAYSEGDLRRTTFPYKGQMADGVLYEHEDVIYLIPISTIVAGRAGSSSDLDDDDDDNDSDDTSDIDFEVDSDEE